MVAIMERIEHIPVMCQEILQGLNLHPGDHVLDCTLGLGGHSKEIIKHISPHGFLIGIDRDADSIAIAKENLEEFAGHIAFVHKDFRQLDKVLESLGIKEVNAILLDLGVSSYQLETPERGFGIRENGPLDMRMDRDSFISAYDLVNTLSMNEISLILKNFGEERWHRRIADHLVRERAKHPIESTEELKRIIISAIPRQYQNQSIHPATRSFQAFRIAVNRELESLGEALDKSIKYLRVGGRICVISFHSLEDRIVKDKFHNYSEKNEIKVFTKKPLRPSLLEVNENPRARSARLRVAEKK
ncbi:MAG: 16S rRNA (cytosine(1402)-N(4))-methyltransferase RsmH [Candidatus Omnitrophica bacterium]|nr:16S rRNA (cytosine(1402)-N(4))-methyltransferase RsmH [Candidatus Omnitrophota bacterium]